MESESNNENIWNDRKKAEEILKNKSNVEYTINKYSDYKSELDDNFILYDLAKEENNADIIKDIFENLKNLKNNVECFKIENLFSGEADGNNCFLEIYK